jgi:hypothetical protein
MREINHEHCCSVTGAAREGLANRIVLFYSSRRPEHSAFLQELQQKHELWMTFFRDTEANLLALMSEVAHAA